MKKIIALHSICAARVVTPNFCWHGGKSVVSLTHSIAYKPAQVLGTSTWLQLIFQFVHPTATTPPALHANMVTSFAIRNVMQVKWVCSIRMVQKWIDVPFMDYTCGCLEKFVA